MDIKIHPMEMPANIDKRVVGEEENDKVEGNDMPRANGSSDEKKVLAPRETNGYWMKLRNRWNRNGVVEIDTNHHKYSLLEGIRLGLNEVLSHPQLGRKDNLTPDDFNHVFKTNVTVAKGKTYEVCCYASPVFSTLRHALGLEDEFLQSIAPADLPYLEFISNSHGGQHFYLTNDKAYFMKTEKHYYFEYFKTILGEYMEHFLKYPHSLIVKYLGLYSIKAAGGTMMYFYVMQSIFYPEERIEVRYDLKGCLANRFQKPSEPESDTICVLKDKNFLGEELNLGGQREWFLTQIGHDVEFLQSLGVQDYSLLVGKHKLQNDEKKQDMGDLVFRVTRSVNLKTSASEPSPQASPSKQAQSTEMKVITESIKYNAVDTNQIRSQSQKMSFIDPAALDENSRAVNRRLLPNCKNPLHVIDGPEYRYHLGIIDFFTKWECRQRTSRILKGIRYCCGDHSTIPPTPYGERLKQFISDHIV